MAWGRQGPISEGLPPPSTRRRERFSRRMLVVADVLAAAASLLLVVELGPGRSLAPATLLAMALLVLACKLLGLYDRDELILGKSTLDEAPRLMQVSGLYTLVVWLLQDVIMDGGLTRGQVLGLWSSSFVLLVLGRSLARRVSRRATSAERILVVGEPGMGRHVRRKVRASPAKADVVAAVPLDDPRVGRGLAGRDDFQALVRRLEVHRVIVAPETTDSAEILDLIRVAKALGVRVSGRAPAARPPPERSTGSTRRPPPAARARLALVRARLALATGRRESGRRAPRAPGADALAAYDRYARWSTRRGLALLARGEVAITDRLHGHILCVLAGIPHVVLADRNGKIRAYWDAWSHAVPTARWAPDPDAAAIEARRLVSAH